MADDRDPMELQPMQLEDVASNPLTPSTLGQAMQLANMLAKSSLVPEAMQGKPVNVLMALMKGAEVGMTPVQTLSSVFVVDGKAEFYGKGMLAIVMQHPDYYDRKEWFTDYEGKATEHQAHCAHCVMYRTRRDGTLTTFKGVFSLEEAKQGGLDDKKNWRKSPDRMLMWRARSIAADAGFADALRGMSPRPNQSADDFAVVELRPAITAAFEKHGIKPPQADEPLSITCNCIDAAGFAQHDCLVCGGSGQYTDPRTDGSAPGLPVLTVPFDRDKKIDLSQGVHQIIDPDVIFKPDAEAPPADLVHICGNCGRPFTPNAENMSTCATCLTELNSVEVEDGTLRTCGGCGREFKIPNDESLEVRCTLCKAGDTYAESKGKAAADDDAKPPTKKKKAKAKRKPKAKAKPDPGAPSFKCPVCEGDTTRSDGGEPMTCDDCNNRAAKAK